MTDAPVLFVDGALKGRIMRMPTEALVSVEPVDPHFVPTVYDAVGEHRQVRYRKRPLQFHGLRVWIGWCGEYAEPPTEVYLDVLLSDAAKQLMEMSDPYGEKHRKGVVKDA